MTNLRWQTAVVAVLAGAVGLAACRHVPTDKELEGASIRYNLGIQAQQTGDVQSAYKEFDAALKLDPSLVEAHNAIGILLHLSFKRPEEAIVHYQQALKIRPSFSEAKTNLANVYLDQQRYDEAIALYEEALNDMLYATPYIAQGNLGWSLYKRGKAEDVPRAVQAIKAATTLNPKFCLGYRNLGQIEDARGNAAEACKQYGRYRDACPDVADAYYRAGVCLAKTGDNEGAKRDLAVCQAKAQNDNLRDDCKQLLGHLQ